MNWGGLITEGGEAVATLEIGFDDFRQGFQSRLLPIGIVAKQGDFVPIAGGGIGDQRIHRPIG